jgi:hypothetical protein
MAAHLEQGGFAVHVGRVKDYASSYCLDLFIITFPLFVPWTANDRSFLRGSSIIRKSEGIPEGLIT